MSTTTSTVKPSIVYDIREMNNIQTGEKSKRAFPRPNGVIGLTRLSTTMSSDYGRMSGKPSHVASTIVSIMESVLDELKLGNAVVLDKYLKFTPTFRGKVDPETGKPTQETELYVTIRPLEKMKLECSSFNLVSSAQEVPQPKITNITAWALNAAKDVIVRNMKFKLSGRNLYFDAAMGDTITLGITVDGEPTSLTLTPTDALSDTIIFEFPSMLAEAVAGSEIEIVLRTHSGVKDGALNVTSRKAVLADA